MQQTTQREYPWGYIRGCVTTGEIPHPLRYHTTQIFDEEYHEDFLHYEDSKMIAILIAYQQTYGMNAPVNKDKLLGIANEFERYLLFVLYDNNLNGFADPFHNAYATLVDLLKE